MQKDRIKYLRQLNLNPAVSSIDVEYFEKKMGFCLPEEYAEFLKIGEGGEGFIGKESYIILWKLEEIVELNDVYNVAEYAPGLLLFGSSGGGKRMLLI